MTLIGYKLGLLWWVNRHRLFLPCSNSWSKAASKRMARDYFPGKIVFVSSFLGFMSMVGYASYAPAKHAVRGKPTRTHSSRCCWPIYCSQGLAETLRSELLLYSVSVHIFFPGTIYSPGYTEENKTKPKITLKIEETDDGQTPEKAAEALLRGKSWEWLVDLSSIQFTHFWQVSGKVISTFREISWETYSVLPPGVQPHIIMCWWMAYIASLAGYMCSLVEWVIISESILLGWISHLASWHRLVRPWTPSRTWRLLETKGFLQLESTRSFWYFFVMTTAVRRLT
jgi:hypothetical protein